MSPRKKARKPAKKTRKPAEKNRNEPKALASASQPVENRRQTTMNYRWVNENLKLEYEMQVDNGHTAQFASSTLVQAADRIFEDLGLGGPWQGQQLNVTAMVRREQPAADPRVSFVVWQTDPTGTVPGRINAQPGYADGVFDEHGFASIDVLVTFD